MVSVSTLTHVRDAIAADVPAISVIERASFVDPWSPRMFTVCLQSDVHLVLVAESADRQVLGFAVIQIIGSDAEVLDIAVTAEARGQGIGRALLDTVLARCVARRVAGLTLEVRESNIVAHALYASRDFHIVGRRRRYYHSPTEDALILKIEFPVFAGNEIGLQCNADA